MFLLRLIFLPLTILRFILMWINTLVFLGILIIESKLSTKPNSYKFIASRYWGRFSLAILGIYVVKNKRPNIDKFILMPNHRSYVDILIAAAYSPSTFVSKSEVAKWPLLGRALKAHHAILVKRNELKSLLKTMKKIKKSIENGISITVFPEGTTFKGPGTKPFKNGTFKIASENNITVIPCAIEYHDRKMAWISDDTFVGHFFLQMWKPIHIAYLQFGNPIFDSDPHELKEKTRASIEKMLESIHTKEEHEILIDEA